MFVQDQLSRSAVFAFHFFKRFAKVSLLGIFALGATGLTAFEGAHMWVENVELAADTDPEAKRWEWDCDAEKWSGGDQGGTDPALGFKARHAVRAAWMAENWGSGSQTGVVRSTSHTGHVRQGSGTFDIVDARLGFAEEFLSLALEIAEDVTSSGKLRARTPVELAMRHAAVLERMGTKDAFFDARSDYERVWFGLAGQGPDAPRTALKLGDLNFRLGDHKDALEWWARTIGMIQESRPSEGHAAPTISQKLPSSPSAQRTLAATLVSLSAYYSTTRQFERAQTLQQTALSLLRSIPAASSVMTASPHHLLHSLFLLHRSSLISIHHAEVLYAVRSPRESSLNHLAHAAESAERVVLALCGKTIQSPKQGKLIPPVETSLIESFTKSIAMRKPAKALLRDARRTAVEAWNLMGILSEGEKDGDVHKALDCYERALAWAGAPADGTDGSRGPGEGIPEAEWDALWNNYVRAREVVRGQGRRRSD
ncbi:hypothetical protein ID866_3728 [Astraeus odoratus]|nr:hypothetical protein ID866_3728 [Astraeus odoratus]